MAYCNKGISITSREKKRQCAIESICSNIVVAVLDCYKQCLPDTLPGNREPTVVIRYMCSQEERHLHLYEEHSHTYRLKTKLPTLHEALQCLIKSTFNQAAENKTCLLSFIPLLIFCSHLFLQASFHILFSFFFPPVKGTFIEIHALKDRHPCKARR